MLLIEGTLIAIIAFLAILWYTRGIFKETKVEEESGQIEEKEPFFNRIRKRLIRFFKDLSSAAEEDMPKKGGWYEDYFDPYRLNVHRSLRYNIGGPINFPGQRKNPYSIKNRIYRQRIYRNVYRDYNFGFPLWPHFMPKKTEKKVRSHDNKGWGFKQLKSSLSIIFFRLWLKLKKYFSTS